MRNLVRLFSIMFIGTTILACNSRPIQQATQEPLAETLPEITKTPLPSQTNDPDPSASLMATRTTTPSPTLASISLTNTAVIPEPSATFTAVPSATPTFEPTEILRGSFYGVDENHLGSGNAIIIQTQVGEYTLHLKNFNVTNGPGLHVILAEDDNPYSVPTLGDYLDLGELKSTSGDQTYNLPIDVNLDKYGSVVVYCLPFQAIFAIAPIK